MIQVVGFENYLGVHWMFNRRVILSHFKRFTQINRTAATFADKRLQSVKGCYTQQGLTFHNLTCNRFIVICDRK